VERDRKLVKRTFEVDLDSDMSIDEVILKLQEKKSAYGDSVRIEPQDYDDRNCLIFIYERLESDVEFDNRRRAECEFERRRLAAEEKEKQLYLTLKAKYEQV
jgi:hypothetical protein